MNFHSRAASRLSNLNNCLSKYNRPTTLCRIVVHTTSQRSLFAWRAERWCVIRVRFSAATKATTSEKRSIPWKKLRCARRCSWKCLSRWIRKWRSCSRMPPGKPSKTSWSIERTIWRIQYRISLTSGTKFSTKWNLNSIMLSISDSRSMRICSRKNKTHWEPSRKKTQSSW